MLGTFLAVALACVLAVAVTGCASQTPQEEQEDKFTPSLDTNAELTLNVAGVYGNFESLDAVAVAFQEYYPNIQVEYISMSDFITDLKNRLSKNTGTDLIASNWLNPYDKEQDFLFDSLEDLNSVDIDFSDIDPKAIQYGAINGEFYALPIFMETQGLAVNTGFFEKNNIDIPQNYQELLESCKALADAGYKTPILTHDTIIAQCFLPYTYELMNKGESIESAVKKAVNRTDEFVGAGYIHPDSKTLEDRYNAMIMRFLEGDIPLMTISSTDYSGLLKRQLRSDAYKDNPFDYTFIPFPAAEEKDMAYMERLSILSMGVNKNSENLDYANELLRFMATDKAMGIFAEKKGSPTPTKSGFDLFPYLRDAKKAYLDEYSIAVEDAIKKALRVYHLEGTDQKALFKELDTYIDLYEIEK